MSFVYVILNGFASHIPVPHCPFKERKVLLSYCHGGNNSINLCVLQYISSSDSQVSNSLQVSNYFNDLLAGLLVDFNDLLAGLLVDFNIGKIKAYYAYHFLSLKNTIL